MQLFKRLIGSIAVGDVTEIHIQTLLVKICMFTVIFEKKSDDAVNIKMHVFFDSAHLPQYIYPVVSRYMTFNAGHSSSHL